MIDDEHSDLSLLIGTEEPGGRRGRGRRRRRWGGLGIVLSLLVIAALIVGIFYGGRAIFAVFADVPDYAGEGVGQVQVRINDGETASDIAATLTQAGVVKSERAFRNAATADPDSRSIQPGLYQLREHMQATSALALLLDPTARLIDNVTIPEGFTVAQILPALAEATGIPVADFQAALGQTPLLGLPAYAQGRPEGFLFPSTYEFDPADDPLTILQSLVAQFTSTAAQLQLEQGAQALGVSPYDIVVIASMIESESKIDAERPMIARVIYNRLAVGMPLGIDATSLYEVAQNGGRLSDVDFTVPSPYNTRINTGLPPTPISNPGRESLQAALSPAAGPWIYYVLESADGHHFFTDSAAEFEAAKARCQAAGLGCG